MSRDRDDALWEAIKKTIKPLRKLSAKLPSAGDRQEAKAPARTQKSKPTSRASPPPERPSAPAIPPLAMLDRRARQKIARGRIEIGARIDLHGLKQGEARDRLLHFLHRAQERGQSLVLVITGKGTAAPEGAERGVLRRAVPLWLALPEFRPLVIGFEEAAPNHGGAGALYVRIRRNRA